MSLYISGRVTYVSLETGFWGIIADDDTHYYVLNMPEQLKHEQARVKVVAEVADDIVTMAMWGIPVRLLSFQTLMP